MTLQSWATAATWQELAGLTNNAFRESDITYVGGNYYLFATATYGGGIATTVGTSLGVTGVEQTITPASMSGIYPGKRLLCANANTTNSEVVVVASITATTFNATFTSTKSNASGGWTVKDNQGDIDMYVADSPQKLAAATPIRLQPTGTGVLGAGVYPSVVYDSATTIWHLYAQNYAPGGAIRHFQSSVTPTATSFALQTTTEYPGFTLNFQGLVDVAVRKHPSDGKWYAIGIPSTGDQARVTVVWADGPHGMTTTTGSPSPLAKGLWRPLTGDTYNGVANAVWNGTTSPVWSVAGKPAWTDYAAPDPNLAFTSDGKAQALFTAKAASTDEQSAFTSGIVELSLTTGYSAVTAAQLPNPHTTFTPGTGPLSDLVYLSVGSGVPDRVYGFQNGAVSTTAVPSGPSTWGYLEDSPTLPGAGQYGEGYPNNLPVRVKVEIGLGVAQALVDVSNDLTRQSVKIRRDAATGMVTADFDVPAHLDLIGGTRYTITDWLPVHISDPSTGEALFMGYTTEVSDRIDGAEKHYHITCQSVAIDLQKPTRQITTQYPPGDGTPVISTTSLTPISGAGTFTFTARSAANLYGPYVDSHNRLVRGRKCFAQNADGTNRELITISTVSGTSVTAPFVSSKTVADTTVVAALTGTGEQTVMPVSMTSITTGTTLIVSDAGGANEETVTVTATPGGTQFTATFANTHTANWLVKVRWQLLGGLPAYDLAMGGWKQLNTADPPVLTAYQSLIDEYYNTPPSPYTALPVLTNAVADTGMSLPHTKLEDTTPGDALQSVVEASTTFNYRRTCTATFTSGSNRVITPDSMVGIAAGAFIYMANGNGSNPERQMVKAVTSTTFTSDLTYNKTGTPDAWIINTGSAPVVYMGWDNTFTRQLVMVDLYDFSLNTTIELTDATVISSAQSHYNTGYERRVSGADRGSKITVTGKDGAQGSYEDTAVTAAMGRVVELPPVQRDDLLTNAECVAVAAQIVAGFSKSRESLLSLSTHQRISSTLFRSAHIVRWTNTLEGGTPAYYPIQDCELSYDEGIAKYTFTVGDRLAELGDKALPAYGASSLRDRTAPAAPTWAASLGWVLVNTYVPYSHDVTIEVQATLAGELDLKEAHFAYRQNSGRWNYSPPVAVNGGATSATFLVRGLTVGATVDWFAWAVDTSDNPSDVSATATVVASSVVNPVAPTPGAGSPIVYEVSNRYNAGTGLVDVLENFTPAAQPAGITVVEYQAVVTPAGSYTRFYYGCTGSPFPLLGLPPGVLCDCYLYAVTDSGFISGQSALRQFPTAAAPANDSLPNPDFTEISEFNSTKPARWAETSLIGGVSTLDNTSLGLIKGTNSLKQHVGNSTLPLDKTTMLSDPVACFDPTTPANIDTMHVQAVYKTALATGNFAAFVRWYSDAAGTVQIGGDVIPTTGGVWSGTPIAAKTVLNTNVTPAAGALSVRLGLRYQSTGTTNDLYWGGCALEVATSPNSIGSGSLTGTVNVQGTGSFGGPSTATFTESGWKIESNPLSYLKDNGLSIALQQWYSGGGREGIKTVTQSGFDYRVGTTGTLTTWRDDGEIRTGLQASGMWRVVDTGDNTIFQIDENGTHRFVGNSTTHQMYGPLWFNGEVVVFDGDLILTGI